MAGKRSSKGNRKLGKSRARRRRGIGLGGSAGAAGAFVTFGLYPPAAHADPLIDVIDLVINSAVGSAASAIPVDFASPAAMEAALAGLSPPPGGGTGLTDLANPANLDALFGVHSSLFSGLDTAGGAANPAALQAL